MTCGYLTRAPRSDILPVMIVDVDAAVLSNTRLSEDYNVVAFDAPAIAGAAKPGQFVMVKTSNGLDPLLRRPFSIFEILRDAGGAPAGFTLINKKVGVGTARLYDARPGDRLSCLGPLGNPFQPVPPPAEAWIVAGGVGIGPFVTLATELAALGTPRRLFYGARRAEDLHRIDAFEPLGIEIVCSTEDGSRGDRGLVTGPLERALAALPAGRDVRIYACGPTPMMRAVSALADRFGRRCDVSLEQVMGCGMGGCYSCVVRVNDGSGPHFVRSCIAGPVFEGRTVVWDELSH